MSTITPAPRYILLEPITIKRTFQTNESELYARGIVLQIGYPLLDQGHEYPDPCKVGDTVIHATNSFQEFQEDGKTYRIIRYNDVLAVIGGK